jgi:hypothetical protein
LKTSEQEVSDWKERSMKLSTSLDSISTELTSSHELTESLKSKLRTALKWAYFFGALFALRLVLYAIGIFLYVKKVKVPRWLDLLL